jgi:hypothetical protein
MFMSILLCVVQKVASRYADAASKEPNQLSERFVL